MVGSEASAPGHGSGTHHSLPGSVSKEQRDGSLDDAVQVVAIEPQGWKDLKKSRTQNCLF